MQYGFLQVCAPWKLSVSIWRELIFLLMQNDELDKINNEEWTKKKRNANCIKLSYYSPTGLRKAFDTTVYSKENLVRFQLKLRKIEHLALCLLIETSRLE